MLNVFNLIKFFLDFVYALLFLFTTNYTMETILISIARAQLFRL